MVVTPFRYIIFAINFEDYAESHKNHQSSVVMLSHFAMQNRPNEKHI